MAFVNSVEFGQYLGQTVTNSGQVDVALNVATAMIRNETAQTISLVTDDTVTIRGSAYSDLVLPERPVVSVGAVTGEALNADEWTASGGVLYRSAGWPALVEITYTHGYATIPDDIRGLCFAVAARILASAGGGVVASETIGNYSITYARNVDYATRPGFLDHERAILRRYRLAATTVRMR